MSRRMIDGSFFTNERVAQMPPQCRLFLLGLIINVADDQGRMSANPAYLRALVLPFDDVSLTDIQGFLEVLIENNTIKVYDAEGKHCAQFVNWWSYQDQMQYAAPSKLPPPEGWEDRVRLTIGRGQAAVTYNWHLRDGTRVADTCDRTGKPTRGTGKGDNPLPPPQPDKPVQPSLGIEPAGIGSDEAGGAPSVESSNPPPKIVSDDPPTGPKHLRDRPDPGPPIKPATLPPAALKKQSSLLGFDPRKMVRGKFPKGTGVSAFEIYYEYVSIHDFTVTEFNRDRILEKVKDLQKWRTVLEAWLGRQYKPDNFSGILSWYVEGIPANGQSKSTTNGKQSSGDSSQARAGDALGQRATLGFGEATKLFAGRRVGSNKAG